jgi:hypothetical protein
LRLQELLLRVLAAALRRYRRDCTFDELQQGLLHALARDVTGDRRVVGLPGDLVDLVDIDDDDAGLRLVDVVVAFLQQLLDDVLDVLADVTGLGQRRRVRDRERHVQKARQRLGQQRLAAAGRADQQDVGLGELDVVLAALVETVVEALVVVVDGDRENLLRTPLPDDVLVQYVVDFHRFWQLVVAGLTGLLELLADDVVAQLDAFVTDEYGRARNQLADFVLGFAAKRTVEEFAVLVLTAGFIAHKTGLCDEIQAENSFGP